jgi:hypothetical protein
MREARVQARAIPELQAALKMNQITLYRAGEIAKLPAGQQEIAMAQWTSRSLCRSQGQEIAAAVIREELSRKSKVDLNRVAAAIRDAISQNFPGCPPKPSNAYRY